jgi:tRNA acetyltransferase TAN1
LNLIITCARHFEEETKGEFGKILKGLGDEKYEISFSNMSGILTAVTGLDPLEVIRKIKNMILDEPWSIRYCSRIIPIQKVTSTDLDSISGAVLELIHIISPVETYRISIEKRNSNISSQELISRIASIIKNKVSLEYPDKVILVEILGSIAGVAIVKKADILSVEITKRSISD